MDVINDTIMVNINLEDCQDDSIVEVVSYIGSMRSVLNIFRGQDAHDMYHILMNPNLLKVHKDIIKSRLVRDDSFMKKEFYVPDLPAIVGSDLEKEKLSVDIETFFVDNDGTIHENERLFCKDVLGNAIEYVETDLREAMKGDIDNAT